MRRYLYLFVLLIPYVLFSTNVRVTHSNIQVVNPWVDVRAFRAVGDSTTDCNRAIYNAATYALATNRVLYMPAGGYKVDRYNSDNIISISLGGKTLRIVGDGPELTSIIFDTTLIRSNNASIYLFLLTGPGRVEFYGIKFLGNKGYDRTLTAGDPTDSTSNDDMQYCIRAAGTSSNIDLIVKNCEFDGFHGQIKTEGYGITDIQDSYFHESVRVPIFIRQNNLVSYKYKSSILIKNNYLWGAGKYMMDVSPSGNVGQYEIYIEACNQDIQILNNKLGLPHNGEPLDSAYHVSGRPLPYGVQIQNSSGTQETSLQPRQCLLDGNFFTKAHGGGWVLFRMYGAQLVNNVYDSLGGAAIYYLGDYSTETQYRRNTLQCTGNRYVSCQYALTRGEGSHLSIKFINEVFDRTGTINYPEYHESDNYLYEGCTFILDSTRIQSGYYFAFGEESGFVPDSVINAKFKDNLWYSADNKKVRKVFNLPRGNFVFDGNDMDFDCDTLFYGGSTISAGYLSFDFRNNRIMKEEYPLFYWRGANWSTSSYARFTGENNFIKANDGFALDDANGGMITDIDNFYTRDYSNKIVYSGIKHRYGLYPDTINTLNATYWALLSVNYDEFFMDSTVANDFRYIAPGDHIAGKQSMWGGPVKINLLDTLFHVDTAGNINWDLGQAGTDTMRVPGETILFDWSEYQNKWFEIK